MRRSFRVGVLVGLLVGVVLALAKIMQTRRGQTTTEPATWPAFEEPETAEPRGTAEPPSTEVAEPESPAPVADTVAKGAAPVAKAAKRAKKAGAKRAKKAGAGRAKKTSGRARKAAKKAVRTAAGAAAEKAPAKRAKKAARKLAAATAWVEPDGDVCPPSHPIKAKLSSGLFHLPGMIAYNRTRPDRCYPDEAAATEDGLTRAKR